MLHETGGSVALAHGEVGALLAGHASWLGLRASVRGVADADTFDASQSGAVAAALRASKPRSPSCGGFGELRHRIEPVVAVAALASDEVGSLGDIASRGMAAASCRPRSEQVLVKRAVAAAGLRPASAMGQGRWSRARGPCRRSPRRVGCLSRCRPMARPRGRRRVQRLGEGAHVFSGGAGGTSGDAFVLRARIGAAERVSAWAR